MEPKDIIDKNVRLGVGQESYRLVALLKDGRGTTFFAGEKTIEQAPLEEISCGITPNYVKCTECFFEPLIKPLMIGFRLGQNRFLFAIHQGKGNLFAAYQPDEYELINGSSEVMSKCRNRGLW